MHYDKKIYICSNSTQPKHELTDNFDLRIES